MPEISTWLLAESGSTKCDWLLFQGSVLVGSWSSAGFNLRVQGAEAVRRQLAEEVWPRCAHQKIGSIYFYGPSLSTPAACAELASLLREGLPSASRVEVAHDLLAAARACCGDRPGVVGILGTGSNACRYDGRQITHARGGWGYLLGDEGSGMDLGRRLLKAALDGHLPPAEVAALEAEWGCPAADLAQRLYALPRPNVRLAELAPLLIRRRSILIYKQLIQSSLVQYIELSFKPWDLSEGTSVDFVGSIAAELESELALLLPVHGLRLGQVLARPMSQLAIYHVKIHESTGN